MTHQEYLKQQELVITITSEILGLRLTELQSEMESVRLVAPILTPKAYRQQEKGLKLMQELVGCLREYQEAATLIYKNHNLI